MLDHLSNRLQKVLKFIRGEGKVTESNMSEALHQIKLALLEADVNYKIVKEFIEKVRIKAFGQEVLDSLTPGQQVVKIVKDELTSLLGNQAQLLNFSKKGPSVFLLVGLQGCGKTTTCGKLAKLVLKINKNPLLASLDLKRFAAQEQLKKIAQAINIPFYEIKKEDIEENNSLSRRAEEISNKLLKYAQNMGFDSLIVDTAGRLHIDEQLMEELEIIKKSLQPTEIIYIGDSMTGQDAVKSAQIFDQRIEIDSIILTKLDGDARGGAALSIVSITGKPIKFIGVGEKYDQLEIFHPDRLASRILGLGDVLSLIEKAEEVADLKRAEEVAKKIRRQEFNLEDFRKQLAQIRKIGSFSQIIKLLPSVGPLKNLSKVNIEDKKLVIYESIINSMSYRERENPKIINGRRKLRIAKGSGRSVQEVNQLLKQYFQMKKMIKEPIFRKMINSLNQ
ncbi:MAG: signal recognition particle protein [Candidatus Aminicenantia bacterium]